MANTATVSGSVHGRPRFVSTGDGLIVTSFLLRAHVDEAARIRLPIDAVPGCYLVTVLGEKARDAARWLRPGAAVTLTGTIVLRESADPPHVLAELHAEVLDVGPVARVRPAAVEPPGAHAILS